MYVDKKPAMLLSNRCTYRNGQTTDETPEANMLLDYGYASRTILSIGLVTRPGGTNENKAMCTVNKLTYKNEVNIVKLQSGIY